jgi:heptosyltransferase I
MNKHAVDRYLDIPRYLGANIANPGFIVPIDKRAAANTLLLLNKHGLENKKFIAINPVAYWETKLWDDVKFARLADLIADNLHITVVFTGSETEAIKKIIGLMKSKPVDLSGKTSLLDLAYLYRQALTVVTTDSGPMHLAAAVGTPVIALFGPTDPARTGPYGQGHSIVKADLPCSPCFLKKCATKKCMVDISPEQVLAVIKEKIRGGNNAIKSLV